MRITPWLLGACLACSAVVACKKSAETERTEADRAAAEADKKIAKATGEADKKVGEAKDDATRAANELHATVVREKVDFRTKIHETLDSIDKDLTDLHVDPAVVTRGNRTNDAKLYANKSRTDFDKIERLLLRRDRLMETNDAIDHTSDRDWPSLKARIDRDLQEKVERKPGRT